MGSTPTAPIHPSEECTPLIVIRRLGGSISAPHLGATLSETQCRYTDSNDGTANPRVASGGQHRVAMARDQITVMSFARFK